MSRRLPDPGMQASGGNSFKGRFKRVLKGTIRVKRVGWLFAVFLVVAWFEVANSNPRQAAMITDRTQPVN